ncbi:MAG: C-terminal binding protein [Albidovulum sp.]|nr:C-terminal binding protein [Albidovulum sp.]MDE0533880.1 C-terminal binding protein [Albidovulum sp.]
MARRKVVVTDYNFPDLECERAAALECGADFFAFQSRNSSEVAEAVAGASVAAVQFATFGSEAAEAMSPNATVIRYGVGYDNIDIAAASDRNIAVGYVPDYCVSEVAEHTAAASLSLLRKLPGMDSSVRNGEWTAVSSGRGIKPFSECLFGFLGFGNIGRAVYERLKPFGFKFLVADPIYADSESESGYDTADKGRLFRECDAISIHAPLNSKTSGIVCTETLSTMKPNAVVVNASRGGIVVEADLAAALKSGKIGGAALDVFREEPLSANSPLRDAPNLLLSPHAAWYSDSAIGRLQSLVADDIRRALTGLPPRCRIV